MTLLQWNRPRFQLRGRQYQVREEDKPPGEEREEEEGHVSQFKNVVGYHSRFRRITTWPA